MRLRLPTPARLLIATVLLAACGIVGHFWWEYRQVKDLEAEVAAFGGSHPVYIDYNAPQWLVHGLARIRCLQAFDWLATDLIQVQAEHKSVDDVWLQQLLRYRHLNTVWLNESSVTDAGLASLATLPKMERLYLNKTNVTDRGLAVTDAGLPHLAAFPKLKYVVVTGSKVSRPGLRLFKASNPHLSIQGP